MAGVIGDDWRLPGRDEWESMPEPSQKDPRSGDRLGFTPRLSYEDRIRTVLSRRAHAVWKRGWPASALWRRSRKRCAAGAMAFCRLGNGAAVPSDSKRNLQDPQVWRSRTRALKRSPGRWP